MDSYLTISENVLRSARRPLTAKEILEVAYTLGIAPSHLYGKTQQKTLGARLSEDILVRRGRSAFFRTEPGRFFLTEFLDDTSLPEKYRTPIVARRRERELRRGRVLALSNRALPRRLGEQVSEGQVLNALRRQQFRYLDAAANRGEDDLLVWSFVMVTRGCDVLTYRHGRYREGRNSFLQRRSVGFFTPVVDVDKDLFDRGDHGMIASGVRAVVLDLDMPGTIARDAEYQKLAGLRNFIVHQEGEAAADLLAIVTFECPTWFEPLTRRLAINDLAWLNLDRPVNHIEDFDPWSQRVLQEEIPASRRGA